MALQTSYERLLSCCFLCLSFSDLSFVLCISLSAPSLSLSTSLPPVCYYFPPSLSATLTHSLYSARQLFHISPTTACTKTICLLALYVYLLSSENYASTCLNLFSSICFAFIVSLYFVFIVSSADIIYVCLFLLFERKKHFGALVFVFFSCVRFIHWLCRVQYIECW